MKADHGLLETNYASLNDEFYARQPWVYFLQRLSHLLLVATGDDGHRERLARGITFGRVTAAFSKPADSDMVPTAEQTFTAIESQVLLHHVAETLMRLVHAHAEPDPCPWLRMSRMTRFSDFKDWVRQTIVEQPHDGLDELCRTVFVLDDALAENVHTVARWLRVFAAEFLNSASYNAAKHGMAIGGAAQRWSVTVADTPLVDHDGASLEWLERKEDENGRRRWVKVARLMSWEATSAVIFTGTNLIQGLWENARVIHLGDEAKPFAGVLAPRALNNEFGVARHVLQEQEVALRYDDNGHPNLIIRLPYVRPPREASAAEGGAADDGQPA